MCISQQVQFDFNMRLNWHAKTKSIANSCSKNTHTQSTELDGVLSIFFIFSIHLFRKPALTFWV